MDNIVKTIAKNIRKYRKGMSLKTISKISGVPVSTIEHIYYMRKKSVEITTLIPIAKALKISIDKLIK